MQIEGGEEETFFSQRIERTEQKGSLSVKLPQGREDRRRGDTPEKKSHKQEQTKISFKKPRSS